MTDAADVARQCLDHIESCLDQITALRKSHDRLEARVVELEAIMFEGSNNESESVDSPDTSREFSVSLGSGDETSSTRRKNRIAPKRSWGSAAIVDLSFSSDDDSASSPPGPKPVAPLKRSTSLRAPARLSAIASTKERGAPPTPIQKPAQPTKKPSGKKARVHK